MATVKVVPRNAELVKPQELVTLYFIGVQMVQDFHANNALVREKEAEVAAEMKAQGRKAPLPRPLADWPEVYVKTKRYRLPQLGETISVREATAKDLQFQAQWKGQKTLLRAEEGGAAVAKLIKDAVEKGKDPLKLDLVKAQAEQQFAKFTNEEIAALLVSRGLPVPAELEKKVDKPATADKGKGKVENKEVDE